VVADTANFTPELSQHLLDRRLSFEVFWSSDLNVSLVCPKYLTTGA